MDITELVNSYSLRARVFPGLLVLMPVYLSTAILAPGIYDDFSPLLPVLAAMGGVYLLSHLVRRMGRAKQPKLWQSWEAHLPPSSCGGDRRTPRMQET